MPTQRDLIWDAALRLSNHHGSFTVADVAEFIGPDGPTRRTIQDCLTAMETLDLLASEGGAGRAPRVFFVSPPSEEEDDNAGYSPPATTSSSTFPYPGGKGRNAEWILDKLPTHDTYVEVFGGSAALLYNKPASKIEIYNDANEDLTQFFRVLRDRGDELAEWLHAVPYSRNLYTEWVDAFYDGVRPDDPIERAGRFFTLRYMQFAGDNSRANGFKTRAKRSPARTFDNARKRIHELASRFEQVVIENRDYHEILSGYDDTDVDVVFYCDPPYIGAEGYYGGEFDHDEFVATLQTVQSDWMVSYTTLPDGLTEYTVFERERRHRMTRDGDEVAERLVCNFDPRERSPFLSEDVN